MKYSFFASVPLFAALTLTGCAVENETSENEDQKMYLDAWLKTHHPDAERAGMGIYILSDSPAGGDETVKFPGYARVTYTVTDIDGNVSSTSDSTVAKRLGTFDKSYYYGPRVWSTGEGTISKGLEDMLAGMTEQSSRTAMIPGWLQTYNRYGSEEEYMAEVTGNSHQIYTVKINEITDDIMQWQLDTMELYAGWFLDDAEPVYEGLYYHVETPGTGEIEDLHKDTTIFINYTGRLLNGQVFDTTDERTAKDNHIYDASKTYAPMEVTMSADSTEIKLDDNSVITGFSSTLWRMKPMEKGVGMFWSSLGYGVSGSGSLIPEYAPLVFEIEIVKDPDEEE